MITEALRRAGRAAVGVARGRREHARQICEPLGPEALEPPVVERGDGVVEGVGDEPERHVALVLGRPAVQHGEPGRGGALRRGGEQRALADARLAEQRERRGLGARGDRGVDRL